MAGVADLLADMVPTETNALVALKSVLAQLTDQQTTIAKLTADVTTANVTAATAQADVLRLE